MQRAVSATSAIGSAQVNLAAASDVQLHARRRPAGAIAAILGSIDDLIENNRRRVEVLEEMARAIYREWFVQFRYPGHEDVPLVDSALGPIPEGWEVDARRSSRRCSRLESSVKSPDRPTIGVGGTCRECVTTRLGVRSDSAATQVALSTARRSSSGRSWRNVGRVDHVGRSMASARPTRIVVRAVTSRRRRRR